MTKILCLGDIMLDVTAVVGASITQGVETRAAISTQGGGAAANVASWLAVNGTPSHLIARVGDDAAGRTVLAELDRFGVTHSNTVIPDANTGVVVVLVDALGERTMFPDSGANAGLSMADLPPLDEFTAVYLSGYPLVNPKSRTGALDILRAVKERGLPVIFDPSTVGVLLEVGLNLVREWLSLVDVVVLNEEEAHFLSGKQNPVEAAIELLALTPLVVIKRGSSGALAQGRGSALVQIQAVEATIIDTTGAGDAFAAGFIQSWSQGEDLLAALQTGAVLAAQCVAIVGSRPTIAKN
jgi:sugar/nucleoside kinase (ribokinase family)